MKIWLYLFGSLVLGNAIWFIGSMLWGCFDPFPLYAGQVVQINGVTDSATVMWGLSYPYAGRGYRCRCFLNGREEDDIFMRYTIHLKKEPQK